jgi:hypothetical protein
MLKNKLKDKNSRLLFYGLTPPKKNNTKEKIKEISSKHINRIKLLDIDGIVLYDIQDESSRTNKIRPFPFLETIDSSTYANDYLDILNIPIIVYKAIGKYDKDNFISWLNKDKDKDNYSIFVGSASSNCNNKLSLNDAYNLKKIYNKNIVLGGITIFERHLKNNNEHLKVFSKIDQGCEFFISQAIYNTKAAKLFLDHYYKYSLVNNLKIVPIIFTLTPCGSNKTLDFMKWLGISISLDIEDKLLKSNNMLNDSIDICIESFKSLYNYAKKRNIKIGCNVESVSIKKDEIEGSIKLIENINLIIKQY